MRTYVVLAVALFILACTEPNPPVLREIAIWAPGLEVAIDGQGNGRFIKRISGENGRFSLTSEQFEALARRMEVFRRSPDVIAGADIQEYVLHGDRCAGTYSTDQGGISFRWLGPSIDQFYGVDYGCDPKRHAARNNELQAILESLPVPKPVSLP